ncbi:MAG: hypothetical protein KIS92_07205 [Planctomycetota bacterium]|nr:hypothetical protein [Planctomycetota bacterium]
MDLASRGTCAGKPLGQSAAMALGVALLFGLLGWGTIFFDDPSAKPFRSISILASLVIGCWSLLLAARSRASGERSRLAQAVLILPCLAMIVCGFCWFSLAAVSLQLPVTLFLLMVLLAEVEDSPRFVMVSATLYLFAAMPFGFNALNYFGRYIH